MAEEMNTLLDEKIEYHMVMLRARLTRIVDWVEGNLRGEQEDIIHGRPEGSGDRRPFLYDHLGDNADPFL